MLDAQLKMRSFRSMSSTSYPAFASRKAAVAPKTPAPIMPIRIRALFLFPPVIYHLRSSFFYFSRSGRKTQMLYLRVHVLPPPPPVRKKKNYGDNKFLAEIKKALVCV